MDVRMNILHAFPVCRHRQMLNNQALAWSICLLVLTHELAASSSATIISFKNTSHFLGMRLLVLFDPDRLHGLLNFLGLTDVMV